MPMTAAFPSHFYDLCRTGCSPAACDGGEAGIRVRHLASGKRVRPYQYWQAISVTLPQVHVTMILVTRPRSTTV